MAERMVLGDNDIDDVRWLCSLTDSELDLLMGLKHLALLRAKKIGHEGLANKFNLKVLRALSFTYMQNFKEQLKDIPLASGDHCNLLNQKPGGSFESMTIEDLDPYVCSDERKRVTNMFLEDIAPKRKKRINMRCL